jgi:xanthine dehydrogenase large subunit
MLCISTFLAIRDAVAACASPGTLPDLRAPATPEAVMRAIGQVKSLNHGEHGEERIRELVKDEAS